MPVSINQVGSKFRWININLSVKFSIFSCGVYYASVKWTLQLNTDSNDAINRTAISFAPTPRNKLTFASSTLIIYVIIEIDINSKNKLTIYLLLIYCENIFGQIVVILEEVSYEDI